MAAPKVMGKVRRKVVPPTTSTIRAKLSDAQKALMGKDGFFADLGKAAGELERLDLATEDAWDYIRDSLKVLTEVHYTGGRPPEKAYEVSIRGKELFAFSWDCGVRKCRMYLKFVILNGVFYYVSLHVDRPPKGAKR